MANIEMINVNQVNDFGCEDYEKTTEYKATYKGLELNVVTTETNINAVATVMADDPKLLDDIYIMFESDGGYELFRDNNYLDITSWGCFGDDIQIIKDLENYLTALENRVYYRIAFGSGLAWMRTYIIETDEKTTDYQALLDYLIDYLTDRNDIAIIKEFEETETGIKAINNEGEYCYDQIIFGGNCGYGLVTYGDFNIYEVEIPCNDEEVIKTY